MCTPAVLSWASVGGTSLPPARPFWLRWYPLATRLCVLQAAPSGHAAFAPAAAMAAPAAQVGRIPCEYRCEYPCEYPCEYRCEYRCEYPLSTPVSTP